jgi:hypothetical protein
MPSPADIPTSENKTNALNRSLEWLTSVPWTAIALLALGGLLTLAWIGVLGWLLLVRVAAPILSLAAR